MMISGAGGEVKPSHKKKTPPQCDESSSFSSLPYELIVEFFARISKSHYPSLSLVSKTFHSLLSSPELYAGRSKTNDICLYICLRLTKRPCPRWFSIWIKPNRTPTKSSGNFMVPISSSSDSLPASKSTVAMGSDIYAIGGTVAPSSTVRIFDCWRHTWRDAPNMTVARSNAMAYVLGDKIYVMGGCHGSDKSTDWSEVFDTKTQTWRLIPNHDAEAKEGTWNIMDMRRIVWCQWWWVIDNVMYCRSGSGYFMWYDSVGEKWRYVQGLEKLMKYNYSRSHRRIEIVNCGGKIAFMWEMGVLSRRCPNKKIVCGMVAFERLQNEICGKIKWLHGVYRLPNSSIQ
ncbi:PREDICTED: F-box/kelch-repeat protein At4g29370-like [Camelina sativa]|uniref:F-box/kelch-repeat protein At4g29370-like n=1 Tax=Camelina sativa TaxID=90675 RepID=A0ABM0URL9_CAMSA|nr:PREDICTED: F-box/kelch-repeat protein At4g29370-like [Camelina sativa]